MLYIYGFVTPLKTKLLLVFIIHAYYLRFIYCLDPILWHLSEGILLFSLCVTKVRLFFLICNNLRRAPYGQTSVLVNLIYFGVSSSSLSVVIQGQETDLLRICEWMRCLCKEMNNRNPIKILKISRNLLSHTTEPYNVLSYKVTTTVPNASLKHIQEKKHDNALFNEMTII